MNRHGEERCVLIDMVLDTKCSAFGCCWERKASRGTKGAGMRGCIVLNTLSLAILSYYSQRLQRTTDHS
jgi:hypothetical protein